MYHFPVLNQDCGEGETKTTLELNRGMKASSSEIAMQSALFSANDQISLDEMVCSDQTPVPPVYLLFKNSSATLGKQEIKKSIWQGKTVAPELVPEI